MKYFQINEQSDLPDIDQYVPFKAVLAIEETVSEARQTEIANWLVDMGGKYVMVCGENCKSWESPIRQANLDKVELEHMRPEDFVMITIHENEKLRHVFWHAQKQAYHSHVKFDNILAIHLGSKNRSVEYFSIFDKA